VLWCGWCEFRIICLDGGVGYFVVLVGLVAYGLRG